MSFKLTDVSLQVPSKEISVKLFRDALQLESATGVSEEPMWYIVDGHTHLMLDLPQVNPSYSTRLHLSTTREELEKLVPKLKEIEGIEVVEKTHQSMRGQERKTVRIRFKDLDSGVLISEDFKE